MKKISISQLAKICNVSQGTIDRALHGRGGIKQETKEHILSVAREYGYKTECEKIKIIGIIVFDLYNEYFSEIIVKLENNLRKYGYYSLVMFSDKNKKAEIECIEAMAEANVDGIIICPVNDGEEYSKYLQSWKIPVITFGNKVDGIKYVDVNHFEAMKALTLRVIKKNYKKIVYFSPALTQKESNIYGQKKRLDGFLEAVTGNGVEFEVVTEEKRLESICDNNTAVIASTDYYALRLLLSDSVGGSDVIGFDNIGSVEKYKVPIMTVAVDRNRAAEKIVEYVVAGKDDADFYVEYNIVGEENIKK